MTYNKSEDRELFKGFFDSSWIGGFFDSGWIGDLLASEIGGIIFFSSFSFLVSNTFVSSFALTLWIVDWAGMPIGFWFGNRLEPFWGLVGLFGGGLDAWGALLFPFSSHPHFTQYLKSFFVPQKRQVCAWVCDEVVGEDPTTFSDDLSFVRKTTTLFFFLKIY